MKEDASVAYCFVLTFARQCCTTGELSGDRGVVGPALL